MKRVGIPKNFSAELCSNCLKLTCRAPLPTLLASRPPGPDAPGLKEAADSLHEFLSIRTTASDIDSLSISIVTPAGPIFERGYGILRANESDPEKQGSVTRDSIYRIASITKMFTVLETLILRERGVLNWDDPVTKFLPNFTHPSYGWSDYLSGNDFAPANSPITLRQLASHLSGLGRDYPPADVGEPWPRPLGSLAVEDQVKVFAEPDFEEFFNAVAKYPLVAPQYTFPIYSNTGFDLLGLANLKAAESATGKKRTYRQLMKDDVFDPLGLNGTFHQIPNSRLAAQVAVPAANSDMADLVIHGVVEAAGGQYSSLADLTTVMQSFLSPEKIGVISPYVIREWLRPLHAWTDGFYEVGAPWEITKVGGEARLYSKGGNLQGYHSQFSVNPQWSYGVIVLLSGNYTNTAGLAAEAISRFQPVFESLLLTQVLHTYGGVWIGDGSMAVVTIQDQALYLDALVVRDQDVLSILQRKPPGESKGMALWSTGRPHEFRLAIGRSELNDNPDAGCEPYWISLDYPMARGAPLDLILWDGSELVYPSAGVRLRRLAA
ncbi:Beta-lactamase domain-containing protein [Mycena venus]|uniref:Beta-lactamase domain-containing protein n=1 Tax=Mycena venus TaxID=2733690 RepID=A0A8H6XWK4_9AGAR|nr:Beta-lactamase domain-containing protein [Mycena venus]